MNEENESIGEREAKLEAIRKRQEAATGLISDIVEKLQIISDSGSLEVFPEANEIMDKLEKIAKDAQAEKEKLEK